jgi:hypothetical protein
MKDQPCLSKQMMMTIFGCGLNLRNSMCRKCLMQVKRDRLLKRTRLYLDQIHMIGEGTAEIPKVTPLWLLEIESLNS